MSRLSLKMKMVVLPLVLLVIFIGFASIVMLMVVNQMIDRVVDDTARGQANLAAVAQRNFEQRALTVAAMAAGSPKVIEGYELAAGGDEAGGRLVLRQTFDSLHKTVASLLKIKNFRVHFHLPPATSFLRIWRKLGDKDGGDNMSSFRKTLIRISREQKNLTGIEFGRGGFVVRGLVPIKAGDGRYLGSVEYLVDYNEVVRSALTRPDEAAAVYMLSADLKVAKRLSGKKLLKLGRFAQMNATSPKKIDPFVDLPILEDGFKALSTFLKGKTLITALPIADYTGQSKGVLVFSSDLSRILFLQRTLQYAVIGGGLLILVCLGGYFLLTSRHIVRSLKEVLDLGVSISDRDLTGSDLADQGQNEVGRMAQAMNTMKNSLVAYNLEIKRSAESIAGQTGEIAAGNQDLSNRVQNQAAAMEAISASVHDISSSIKSTTSSADEADELAGTATELAQEGGGILKQAVEAVSEVAESSRQINEIVDMVNEIAFQTNLLALNASVEAARAGEAGRGFAVVASEVRTLAVRSAEAAKQIQQLIQESVNRVDRGNLLVANSGEIIEKIIDQVRQVAERVTSITQDSRRQAEAIEEASQAVGDIDQSIQQTAALVEETASASEYITGAVQALERIIASYRLPRTESALLSGPDGPIDGDGD